MLVVALLFALNLLVMFFFFFSSRRRHTRLTCDWSSDVCSSDLAGRGRLARSWVSPPGSGLTVSVLLRPAGVSASKLGWLTLLAGLAAYDAVRGLTTVPCGLKWPNDLLLGPAQRKVAGILAEVADPQGPAVVVGIGLNVAAAPVDQPGATSLAAEGVEVGQTEALIA